MELVSLQKFIDFGETVIEIPVVAAMEYFLLCISPTQCMAQVIGLSDGNSVGER